MTKLILTGTMKLNHENNNDNRIIGTKMEWIQGNNYRKWLETKVSNDMVTIGENNSRMFNRQIICCARLKVKWDKHSKQKAIENAAKL